MAVTSSWSNFQATQGSTWLIHQTSRVGADMAHLLLCGDKVDSKSGLSTMTHQLVWSTQHARTWPSSVPRIIGSAQPPPPPPPTLPTQTPPPPRPPFPPAPSRTPSPRPARPPPIPHMHPPTAITTAATADDTHTHTPQWDTQPLAPSPRVARPLTLTERTRPWDTRPLAR